MLNGKWSRKFDKCVECGRDDIKHASRGSCTNCAGKVWRKTEKGKECYRMANKRWYDNNREHLREYRRGRYHIMYPERALKRKLMGVESLLDLTKGKCRWEGCKDNFPKIYAVGVCRNCYGRLERTSNFPQIKDLYGMVSP